MAHLCVVTRFIGVLIAGYGLYLVKTQIDKGDLNEAVQVTLAGILTLLAFNFTIHSALVKLQYVVASRIYGYSGDKQCKERFGLLIRASIYTVIIFVAVCYLL